MSTRWCAARLMASPSADDEAALDFSACFAAIQNRPPASTMTITLATQRRILDLEINCLSF